MSLFTLFYNLILTITYILLIPYLLYKKRENKYKDAIPAKFFLKNNSKFDFSGIWFHSCSMGEVKAIKPLIEESLKLKQILVLLQIQDLKRQKQ